MFRFGLTAPCTGSAAGGAASRAPIPSHRAPSERFGVCVVVVVFSNIALESDQRLRVRLLYEAGTEEVRRGAAVPGWDAAVSPRAGALRGLFGAGAAAERLRTALASPIRARYANENP